jgi:drug/metabolite transporter (DMT)-like permease
VLLALGTALFAGIAVTLMNVAALDGDPIGATTALQGSTAVIAVAVYGALVWRRRHAGRGIEAGTAGAIVSAGPSTAMPAAVVASAPRRARNSATTLFALLAIGGGSVAADAVFAAASTHGALAVIAVLAGLYPVFTVLASLVFLRQRTTVIQTASAVAALAGITLFALA